MKRLTLLLLAVFVAGNAHANWFYTHWGMTVGQAKTASGGKAQDIPENEIQARSIGNTRCLLEQNYQAGNLRLTAYLCFTEGTRKLVKIQVTPETKDQCPIIVSQLRQKYGTPINDETNSVYHTIEWKDSEGTTTVKLTLSLLTENCYVNYDAVDTDESRGL